MAVELIAAPLTLVELCTPGPRRAPDGIVLFQAARLRPDDLARAGRFPTTSVARTLLDLAARYEQGPLLRALAEAEFRHDLRPADVSRRSAEAIAAARVCARRSTPMFPAAASTGAGSSAASAGC